MKGTTKAMLIGGAAALGIPALANALIYSRRGDFSNSMEGQSGTYKWRRGNVKYHVAGNGEPVLLIHGVSMGNSSYEWRKNFRELAKDFKVYAIDLLGFGDSDKPPGHYDAALFVDLITDFIIDVIDDSTHIVANSQGASLGVIAAKKHKILVRSLLLVCPTGINQGTGKPSVVGKALSTAMSVPVFGTSMYYNTVSKENIAQMLKRDIYFRPSEVTQDMVDHYYNACHQPGADRTARAFLSGMLNVDVTDAFSRIDQPTLIVWGNNAKITPKSNSEAFLNANPNAQLEIIEEAGILPNAERPDQFNKVALQWLKGEFVATKPVGETAPTDTDTES